MSIAITERDVPAIERAGAPSLAAVRAWLYVLALLVVAMVVVGGATRLTGSGLSITEWRPVTGAIPPLTEAAWLLEFEKYRQIDQYQLLNKGMSLADFKFIYWWEWGHRQLGRFLGLAFFVPFLYFAAKGVLRGRLALAVLVLGAMGGLQGAIGWIMVASGLKPGMTAVAPIKLMLHLTLASVILAGLVWVASGLKERARDAAAGAFARPATLLVGFTLVQIALGGLVAGSRAGYTFNTWPLMDGGFAPSLATLFVVTPWIENFVDNVALVQLNHRLVGYALVAFALWHAITAWRAAPASGVARRARAVAGLMVAQGALGVVTLVLVVPLWAGLAHQALAMVVLVMAAAHARITRAEAG